MDVEEIVAKHLYREKVLSEGIGHSYVSWEVLEIDKKLTYLAEAEKHVKKYQNTVPSDSAFNVGQRVRVIGLGRGVVAGFCRNKEGTLLYVVDLSLSWWQRLITAHCFRVFRERHLLHDTQVQIPRA